MRKSLFVVSLCGLLASACYVNVGYASETKSESVPAADLKDNLGHGDAAAGKAASAVCAGCHGVDGVAAIKSYPNLAGQGAPYLVKQLMAFKSGARENAIMAGMVAGLDQTAMENLAAHYAGLPAATGISANTDDLALARNIYRGGIAAIGVPACMSCHSPDGAGNDAAKFPALGGQNAEYVALALQNFRSGARTNDPNKMMRLVTERLSDKEIAALANFVQGLH